MTLRKTIATDIPALCQIADATGLFPGEMLPDMVAAFLDGTSDDLWLTALSDTSPSGFCFARPEALTDGTWNMLAIAVDPAIQGQGHGRGLTQALETHLAQIGARLLIVDTSGTDAFAQTRTFYSTLGYSQEARIRDYWAAGDDKITFRKHL